MNSRSRLCWTERCRPSTCWPWPQFRDGGRGLLRLSSETIDTADATARCFFLLSRRKSAKWVLEGDIRSSLNRIAMAWLLANVPTDRLILRKWLKAGFMDERTLYPLDDGTPQGDDSPRRWPNLILDGLRIAASATLPSLLSQK